MVSFKLFSRICCVVTGLIATTLWPNAHAAGNTNQLCVMTYNLRYAGGDKDENSWKNRRPLMHELIQSVSPDIIGTQEGLFRQLEDIAKDLPDYAWVGTGRDGGNKGEFMAVFYKKSRIEALSTNHFWLSDTPDVVASTTWGNAHRRMVTWLRLKDKLTGQEFYFFNTHFDHQVQVAREKSSQLIRTRVEALKTELPVILTGDFNASADNKAHNLLVDDHFFADTWNVSKDQRSKGLGSFNGFKAVPKEEDRIDWILIRGKVVSDAIEINTFSKNGRFPSDHCPVVTWLRLGE